MGSAIRKLEELSKIGQSEPQAAACERNFCTTVCSRPGNVLHVNDTKPHDVLKPLDTVHDEKFIPAITAPRLTSATGRPRCTDLQRNLRSGISDLVKDDQEAEGNSVAQEPIFVQDQSAERSIELRIKSD